MAEEVESREAFLQRIEAGILRHKALSPGDTATLLSYYYEEEYNAQASLEDNEKLRSNINHLANIVTKFDRIVSLVLQN